MRSTKASAALERLKRRSGNSGYSMARSADGLFFLLEKQGEGPPVAISERLELDDFVALLNGMGPQEIKRITKNDAAFEKQLVKKPTPPRG